MCGIFVFAFHKEREVKKKMENMLQFIPSEGTNIKKKMYVAPRSWSKLLKSTSLFIVGL